MYIYEYIFIAWHLKFEIDFFKLKFCWKKLNLELFPWIRMENFRIRILDPYGEFPDSGSGSGSI